MVIKPKTDKRYKIILVPEFAEFGPPDAPTSALRTFESDCIYVQGTDTTIVPGADIDYFCVKAADGSVVFTVPTYKIRYCTECQSKKRTKVFGKKAVIYAEPDNK